MTSRPFRILHLSDVHFGTEFFLYKRSNDPAAWAKDLADDLERGLSRNGARDLSLEKEGYRQFDLLVFSGDLACHGKPPGMEAAKCFFAEVNGAGDKPGRWWKPDKILIIPGNHDMVFGDDKPTEILPSLPSFQREALYVSTYEEIMKEPPKPFLGAALSFADHRLSVVGLNSSRLESWAAPGIGYVGCDQIKALADQVWYEEYRNAPNGEADSGPWRRIAFLHHHVTTKAELNGPAVLKYLQRPHPTFTLDAEDVLVSLVRYGFDFILHGHFHQPDTRSDFNHSKTYGRILSAGSAGIKGSLCSNLHQFFVLQIQDHNGPGATGASERVLEVKSFERVLGNDGPGDWAIGHRDTFPFTGAPIKKRMDEALRRDLEARVKLAASTYQAYESYPEAKVFLTRVNTPEWSHYIKKITKDFGIIWKARLVNERLPRFEKAYAVLMAMVRARGSQLLEEFRLELLGDDPRSLAAFLVTKVVRDPDLWN